MKKKANMPVPVTPSKEDMQKQHLTEITITEDEKLDSVFVTVHNQKLLLMLPGQSLDIVTHSKKHWYLSEVDGQSFVSFKRQKLWIRLQKAWSILRGDSWWEKIEFMMLDQSGSTAS